METLSIIPSVIPYNSITKVNGLYLNNMSSNQHFYNTLNQFLIVSGMFFYFYFVFNSLLKLIDWRYNDESQCEESSQPESTEKKLIVLRGVPGSGKTSWVSNYIKTHPNESVIAINDYDFFFNEDKYQLNVSQIDEARSNSMTNFLEAITQNYDTIIINNINNRFYMYVNYILISASFGYKSTVFTIPCNNEHELYMFQSRNKYKIPMTYARNVYNDWDNDPKEMILTSFIHKKGGNNAEGVI
jgi:predicted kinase